jgi:hypothetical protein
LKKLRKQAVFIDEGGIIPGKNREMFICFDSIFPCRTMKTGMEKEVSLHILLSISCLAAVDQAGLA